MDEMNCEIEWYQKREILVSNTSVSSYCFFHGSFKAWNLQKYAYLVNKIPHIDINVILRALSHAFVPLYFRIKMKILKMPHSSHVDKYFL